MMFIYIFIEDKEYLLSLLLNNVRILICNVFKDWSEDLKIDREDIYRKIYKILYVKKTNCWNSELINSRLINLIDIITFYEVEKSVNKKKFLIIGIKYLYRFVRSIACDGNSVYDTFIFH